MFSKNAGDLVYENTAEPLLNRYKQLLEDRKAEP
jgi:hypothetical protein